MRSFASLFGRRGVLAAAIVAGGVLALGVLQEVVGGVVTSLYGVGGNIPPMWWESIWGGAAMQLYLFHLPLAIGIFASLWLIAPVAAELRLAHVVTRAILAAGIGASLIVIVQAIWGSIGALSTVGPWFGHAFPELPVESLGRSLLFAVQAGIRAFLYQGATVILGSIFLWIWLQKHPSRHTVAGMIDEV